MCQLSYRGTTTLASEARFVRWSTTVGSDLKGGGGEEVDPVTSLGIKKPAFRKEADIKNSLHPQVQSGFCHGTFTTSHNLFIRRPWSQDHANVVFRK